MTDQMQKLLAAASAATFAAADMIDAAREGTVTPIDNVGSGDTATALADALRLLLEATAVFEDERGEIETGLLQDDLEDFVTRRSL